MNRTLGSDIAQGSAKRQKLLSEFWNSGGASTTAEIAISEDEHGAEKLSGPKSNELQSTYCPSPPPSHVPDGSKTDSTTTLLLHPYQPEKVFPAKQWGKSLRRFHSCYFKNWEWLHWDEMKEAVFCFYCHNVHQVLDTRLFSTKSEPAFSTKGFSSWKEPKRKFKEHEASASHHECVERWLQYSRGESVTEQLSKQVQANYQVNREAFDLIISTIQFLGRQGLSLRGHDDDHGNFYQLLKLRSEDNESLRTFLSGDQRQKYLSHDVQNEILQLLSHRILHEKMQAVRNSDYFAILADEATDCSGKQQLCIAFRWVDDKLEAHEDFVGLHEVHSATAEGITSILLDVLLRLNLDVTKLRGQGYDGCSTMAGCDNGVAARLHHQEPRAVFVHCLAHSVNLAVQEAATSIPMVHACLDFVKELVNFFKNAPAKLRILALRPGSITALKPLCPHRWSVRAASISSVLENLEALASSLLEISKKKRDNSGAKASGLLKTIESFETFVTMNFSLKVFELLDATSVWDSGMSAHFL